MQKKILIIEDEKFLREMCEQKFTKMGFAVESAEDGAVGLQKIIQGKPDLVLLDIILPNMDGFEILKQVRVHADRAVAAVPIIILSNLGQDTDVDRGKKLGANDYLVKTLFTVDDIVGKVQTLLAARGQ